MRSLRFVPQGSKWRHCWRPIAPADIDRIAAEHPVDVDRVQEKFMPLRVRALFDEVESKLDAVSRTISRSNARLRLCVLIRDATVLAQSRLIEFHSYLAVGAAEC